MMNYTTPPPGGKASQRYTSIGRGGEEAVQSFFIFESEFGGEARSADTIPTADSMR